MVEETWLWRRVVALKFGEDIVCGKRGGGGWWGEPPSLEDLFMGVTCGGVSGWVGKLLAKTSSLRLRWGIE